MDLHAPGAIGTGVEDSLRHFGCRVGIRGIYRKSIVNEQDTARLAKQRVSEVRKMDENQAEKAYKKHASRSRRDDVPGT
jgi:hypothetical protein